MTNERCQDGGGWERWLFRVLVTVWRGLLFYWGGGTGIIDQPDDHDTAGLRISGAHSRNAAATSWYIRVKYSTSYASPGSTYDSDGAILFLLHRAHIGPVGLNSLV